MIISWIFFIGFTFFTYEFFAIFTKNITSDSLIKIYNALGVKLKGNVGVKVSTGERGSKGYLKSDLIGPFVKLLNGTIIECNTAYPGTRNTKEDHLKTAEKHGFTSISDVDIMDGAGEFKIPVHDGKHLEYDIIGEHFKEYDSIINLAHGKGHAMGGFGANLKNQSIGIASRNGKAYIHMLWNSTDPGHTKMMERVDRQEGRHITEYAESLGLGSTDYELINID